MVQNDRNSLPIYLTNVRDGRMNFLEETRSSMRQSLAISESSNIQEGFKIAYSLFSF